MRTRIQMMDRPAARPGTIARRMLAVAALFSVATAGSFTLERLLPATLVTPAVALVVVLLGALLVVLGTAPPRAASAPAVPDGAGPADRLPTVLQPGPSPIQPEGGAV